MRWRLLEGWKRQDDRHRRFGWRSGRRKACDFFVRSAQIAKREFARTNNAILAPLQILPTADTVDEALEYIDFWWLLGLHRLRKQEPAFPIVFVFDEFTSFVLSGGERTKLAIKRLLDSINQYRKVQMRVVLIGQTWGQALRAITSLRDSISSAVVFRSSYNDVRKFVPNDQLAKMSNQLATGTAITTIDYDRVIHVTRLNATDQLIAAQRASALSARYPVPLPFLRRNEQYLTLV